MEGSAPQPEQGIPGWWDSVDQAAPPGPPPAPEFPLPGWPSQMTVEYLTKLILLGLLLLALPYLIGNLIVRPAETMAMSARGMVAGAALK